MATTLDDLLHDWAMAYIAAVALPERPELMDEAGARYAAVNAQYARDADKILSIVEEFESLVVIRENIKEARDLLNVVRRQAVESKALGEASEVLAVLAVRRLKGVK